MDPEQSKLSAPTPKNLICLQENDPGEILWDQFSLPELNNFLRILDREEAWYKRQIHEKYELAHLTIQVRTFFKGFKDDPIPE